MGKHIRILALLIIDLILVCFSIYISYLLRFDYDIRPEFKKALPYVMTVYSLLVLTCFYYYKIYKRLWQYASIGDLISILKGSLGSSAIFFIVHQLIVHYFYSEIIVPRSIYILSAMIIFLIVGGSRFLWRIFRDNYIKLQPHHHRALIVGAGDVGIMVAKELKHSNSEYYPVAFIDDDIQKRNLEVLGIPVLGNSKDLLTVVEKQNIDYIIIALPSATRTEIAEILEICKKTRCQIKIVPRVNDLINGKISINMIRNVSVEDLLGRDPINVDLKGITDYLFNHVVLVTGAGGSIGSELCRQIAGFNPKQLLLLGRGENSIYEIEMELRKNFPNIMIEPIIADIQHKHRLIEIFEEYRPQVVFHAAAHKHVPLMEKNPIEAIKNNILGTRNLAECAHEYGTLRFVMISTDKAVNPTSIMGASKKIAEMIVQNLNEISETCFSAVRFGNVLGSRGSVIPVFKRQIEEGGPITVTHPEMIRYFMTIPEAVQLVIQTGALATGGEIFILDMGKPVKIADLARDLIRLSGMEPDKDIKIVYTGLRPGEKLFEELLTAEEGASATKHNRIYVGRPVRVSSEELSRKISILESMAFGNEKPGSVEIRKQIKELVPSFQIPDQDGLSKNAIEEALRASLEIVAAINNK
ncbi:polysaccharide biosynthesis protein [Paenibacillus flagellatus]|uniref:Polysaccharide biosynthesis protein n=1 Tax=Paenibacillus flagellatus TaxID=2211139 RepID=A0A2V5K1F9_9BACL|nr:nucleoside-diphosphate sugar epimerase/dehydratase [Paenibacillus flagellatus]PYI52931.1 polysaccharide biosynthesis protein [Paenibacillus flagellatus]